MKIWHLKKTKGASFNGCISKARANSESKLTFSESSFNFFSKKGCFLYALPTWIHDRALHPLQSPVPLPVARRAQRVKSSLGSWRSKQKEGFLKRTPSCVPFWVSFTNFFVNSFGVTIRQIPNCYKYLFLLFFTGSSMTLKYHYEVLTKRSSLERCS